MVPRPPVAGRTVPLLFSMVTLTVPSFKFPGVAAASPTATSRLVRAFLASASVQV